MEGLSKEALLETLSDPRVVNDLENSLNDLISRNRAGDTLTSEAQNTIRELASLLNHTYNEEWYPMADTPQEKAYYSKASVIGYGGAAGGGKTSLACGKAITCHKKSIIYRRVGSGGLTGINNEIQRILTDSHHPPGKSGTFSTYSYSSRTGWKIKRKKDGKDIRIELGSAPHIGSTRKYQGIDHDFIVFDEATHFSKEDINFLSIWLRSTEVGQKCQVLLTFNPPMLSSERWIIDYFAPWLSNDFDDPADCGEIRYLANLPRDADHPFGQDVWLKKGDPFVVIDNEIIYDYDSTAYHGSKIVNPISMTFIRADVYQNRYLANTGYVQRLQALDEPMRSIIQGNFEAGILDRPGQIIPSLWVDQAVERWKGSKALASEPMDSIGVDVARGGKDQTIIARRHGDWFDEPLAYPGRITFDANVTARKVIEIIRDDAPIHIDAIGVGSGVVDLLTTYKELHVLEITVSKSSGIHYRDGALKLANLRAELWYKMQLALDPRNPRKICLPPNKKLRSDLLSADMISNGTMIHVESTVEMKKKNDGRSPDYATAYLLALIETPKKLNKLKGLTAKDRREQAIIEESLKSDKTFNDYVDKQDEFTRKLREKGLENYGLK